MCSKGGDIVSTIGLVVSYSHIVEAGVRGGGGEYFEQGFNPCPPISPQKAGEMGWTGGNGERNAGQNRGKGGGRGGTWGNRGNFLGEKRALTRTLNPNSPLPQLPPPPNP